MRPKMTVQQYQNCQRLADFVVRLEGDRELDIDVIRYESGCGTNACLVGWMPEALPDQVKGGWVYHLAGVPIDNPIFVVVPIGEELVHATYWFDKTVLAVLGIPESLPGKPEDKAYDLFLHGVFVGGLLPKNAPAALHAQALRDVADRVWQHDHGQPFEAGVPTP
jgi:hypothetical protein